MIAVVAASLLAAELGMRAIEDRLSADVAHIRSAPAVAGKVDGTLALGNSLLREGVDLEALGGLPAYHPDGTCIQEWAYGFRRYFAAGTDRLLLFTGRTHLRDLGPRPTPLGRYYCATGDIPTYLRRDGSGLEVMVEFLLARCSTAFAQRKRIHPRVFTAIIPHYQTALREMNARRNATRADRAVAWTYGDLDLLLRSAGETVIVTVPSPEPYDLEPEIVALAERHGATVLDIADDIDGITPAHFPDGWHLDAEGRAIYTAYLARTLSLKSPGSSATDNPEAN